MKDKLKEKICEVKDFPKPGVGFKDITPLVQDPECFRYAIEKLASWAKKKKAEIIVGIESRGYIFAAPVAHKLKLGLAIIRKKGKLPRKKVSVKAPNEYSVEYFELHEDGILPSQRVIIIDDVMATGSSLISAVDLVKLLKGKPVGIGVVVELSFMRGKENIKKAHPDVDVLSLTQYQE